MKNFKKMFLIFSVFFLCLLGFYLYYVNKKVLVTSQKEGPTRQSELHFSKNRYKKSCYDGDFYGCLNRGFLEYKKGNFGEARKFYKKSCDGEIMTGCLNLGLMEYKNKNLVEARRLYKKSCDGGHIGGCHALGFLEYKKGNFGEARRLYKISCDGEFVEGCFSLRLLGLMEKNKKNVVEVTRRMKKLCDNGDMNVCKIVDLLNEDLPKDSKKSPAAIKP